MYQYTETEVKLGNSGYMQEIFDKVGGRLMFDFSELQNLERQDV